MQLVFSVQELFHKILFLERIKKKTKKLRNVKEKFHICEYDLKYKGICFMEKSEYFK